MKQLVFFWITFLIVFWISGTTLVAQQKKLSADEILEKAKSTLTIKNFSSEMKLTAVYGKTSIVKRFDFQSRQFDDVLKLKVSMASPSTVSFIAYLFKDGHLDSWLKMDQSSPAKKIDFNDLRSSFLKSHLSYEDMINLLTEREKYDLLGVEDYQYRDIEMNKTVSYKAYALRSKSTSLNSPSYGSKIIYIRENDFQVLGSVLYSNKNQVVKRIYRHGFYEKDGLTMAKHIQIIPEDWSGQTILTINKVNTLTHLPNSLFNP